MPEQPARNPAIILVEDEPDILIILHRLMRDLTGGYDIVTVNGGAEALAQIALRPVPLVITDYNMPGMNAAEILRELMNYPRYADIPRIIWSTSASETFKKKCLELGATSYQVKPATIHGLTEVATYMLSFCRS